MNISDSQPRNPNPSVSTAPSDAESLPAAPTVVSGDEADNKTDADTIDFVAVAVPEPSALTRGFTDALPGQLPEHLQGDESGQPSVSAEGQPGRDTGLQATGTPADVAPQVQGASQAASSRPGKPIRRPSWRFLMSHPAHWIALGFGSGLPWVMPGTFGTLFGWMAFVACMPHFTDVHWFVSIVVGFAAGVWACGVTGRNLGVSDHGSIVWDEIVAIWLVLWLVPQTLVDQIAAFVLFRTIDIVKPQPIKYFDARWKNGFGVMFDDLLAAFFTLLLFAIYYRFAGLPV